ncbi:hypothetical protein [Dictyobacter arantiisoli]|uniref:hypothetical protein n=1 Tax=Dictyobacter arantiisoli TaxID=2014874 RepID=UPI0011EDA914|nr:hypothetical protein [Dictyobacter arantiisoli]
MKKQAYRVVGSNAVVVKVAAASVEHLENIVDQLSRQSTVCSVVSWLLQSMQDAGEERRRRET